MPNRYELPNGEIVDVEAKYLNDFIRENPGAILLLQGISTWRNADGDLINVEGEDLEDFVKNTPGASLYNGSTELKKWYKKAVTPYAEKSVFDVNSWDDFTDWFFIDEDETQEKNTWQETLLGKNLDSFSVVIQALAEVFCAIFLYFKLSKKVKSFFLALSRGKISLIEKSSFFEIF